MLDRQHLANLMGVGVAHVVDLGVSHSWALHHAFLDDGREVFVKAADNCASVFAAEAAGLEWLGEVGGPLVPTVLAMDDRVLVLPWLPTESPSPRAAERFGRELAALHSHEASCYGAPWAGYIADLPLDNTSAIQQWPRWFAECRLAPFLRLGAEHLDLNEVRLVERVIDNVESLAGLVQPPSRIHGDLWSGNVVWTNGRAMLIDPAAHGGHRETDLAMLTLFGIPHLGRILAAYNEVAPLADGWRNRMALHQLHPLLVHLALFGSGYRAQVLAAANAAMAHSA